MTETRKKIRMEKIIDKLFIGEGEYEAIYDSNNGDIERFYKNGEIALNERFRQGNVEINGRYVQIIVYK